MCRPSTGEGEANSILMQKKIYRLLNTYFDELVKNK